MNYIGLDLLGDWGYNFLRLVYVEEKSMNHRLHFSEVFKTLESCFSVI